MAKRTFRTNIYGNTVGYEGKKRVAEFRDLGEEVAQYWVDHPEMDQEMAEVEYYASLNVQYRRK